MIKLTDGIAALLLSAASYAFAYSFYAGMFYKNNIPLQFIQISLSQFIFFWVILIGVLCFFMTCIDAIYHNNDTDRVNKNLYIFIVRHGISIILIAIAFFAFKEKVQWIIFFLWGVICFAFIKRDLEIKWSNVRVRPFYKKLQIKFLPDQIHGMSKLAINFKIINYYALFSWFLNVGFICFSLGGLAGASQNFTALCNFDYKVIQFNGGNVLITKDNKVFEFKSVTDCKFTEQEK